MNQFEKNNIVQLPVYSTENHTVANKNYLITAYLGGGATSLVWKAQEVDPENNQLPDKPKVLKVLHEGQESMWQTQFAAEVSVMRGLWQKEEDLADDIHVVPAVYGTSEPGVTPTFMLMEYVSSRSVEHFARPHLGLHRDLNEWREKEREAGEQRKRLLASLRSVGYELSEGEEPISDRALGDQVASIVEKLETKDQLTDGDLILIGQRVARVLQLLHQSGRAYQDFQLANIRWDASREFVKIIDWNVVSPPGSVHMEEGRGAELVQRDLFRLGASLYWLRTLATVPSRGGTSQDLAEWGGIAWQYKTRPLLRMVLEKALSPDPKQRFEQAYLFDEANSSVVGLSDMKSFGGALERIGGWSRLSQSGEGFGKLLQSAQACIEKQLWTDARFLLDLAEAAIERAEFVADAGKAGLRQAVQKERERIEGGIADPLLVYSVGQRLLRSGDLAAAKGYFEQLRQEFSMAVMAERWLYVCELIYSATIGADAQGHFWEDDALPRLLMALEEGKWSAAQGALAELREKLPSVMFKVFQKELEIGRAMTGLNRRWRRVEAHLEDGVLDDPDIQCFTTELNKIDPRSLPYFQNLQEQKWPEWEKWQSLAKEVDTREQRLQETITKIRDEWESDFDGAENELQSVLLQFPGNAELFNAMNDLGYHLLNAGLPDRAARMAAILLKHGGARPGWLVTRNVQQIAHDWNQLRLARKLHDWEKMKKLCQQLKQAESKEISLAPLVLRDLQSFDEPAESQAGRGTQSVDWPQVEKTITDQEVKYWTVELEKLDEPQNVEELNANIYKLTVWQQSSILPQEVHNVAKDMDQILSEKLSQRYAQQAAVSEMKGDSDVVAGHFDEATESYQAAADSYEKAAKKHLASEAEAPKKGWLVDKNRIERKAVFVAGLQGEKREKMKHLLAESKDFRQNVSKYREYAASIDVQLPSIDPALRRLAAVCGLLWSYHVLPSVQSEINEALALAKSFGWSEKQFWQEAKPQMFKEIEQTVSALGKPLNSNDIDTLLQYQSNLEIVQRFARDKLPAQSSNVAFLLSLQEEAIKELWPQRSGSDTKWPLVWKISLIHDILACLQDEGNVKTQPAMPTEFANPGEAYEWLCRHAHLSSQEIIPLWLNGVFDRQTPQCFEIPSFERTDEWLDRCEAWLRAWEYLPDLTTAPRGFPLSEVDAWWNDLAQEIPEMAPHGKGTDLQYNVTLFSIRITRLNAIRKSLQKMQARLSAAIPPPKSQTPGSEGPTAPSPPDNVKTNSGRRHSWRQIFPTWLPHWLSGRPQITSKEVVGTKGEEDA